MWHLDSFQYNMPSSIYQFCLLTGFALPCAHQKSGFSFICRNFDSTFTITSFRVWCCTSPKFMDVTTHVRSQTKFIDVTTLLYSNHARP